MTEKLPTYLAISTAISDDLSNIIASLNPDKIGVLVDEHTKQFCLPLLHISDADLIEISSGESRKTLNTCSYIWENLTKKGFTRQSLLINLGGGVIGDMGGFCAATYKRGIRFINLPTTLLSQVDASIGGKLGVDFHGLKNHIGLFQQPNHVMVYPTFLTTLPERELKSGFAEIIKHALIRSKKQWDYLQKNHFESIDWSVLIPKSIAIKNQVVNEDPREQGIRKILNYGHTLGHAIETFFLSTKTPLLHGEAVALGMILENEIATNIGMLDQEVKETLNAYIRSIYEISVTLPSFEDIKEYLSQDKKNDGKGIRFSLLREVGSCEYDILVEDTVIRQVLNE